VTNASSILSEQCPYCGQPITHQQLEAIRSRVRQEEQQKAAAAMQNRDRDHAAALLQLQQKHAEEKKQYVAQLAQQRAEVEKGVAQAYANELEKQKVALQQVADEQVLKLKEAHALKNLALEKKVLELERSLGQKSANELGEGPERDLAQALRAAFPEDVVQRVAKGEPGADVLHEVIYQNEACGTIIYDSKNHKGWRDEFTSKLKADMIRHGATHGIIVASAFPRKESGFCIKDGVVVIPPKQVVYIADILRNHMVQLHRQGLSKQERAAKMVALFAYMGGSEFSARLNEALGRITLLQDMDVKERKAHEAVWKARLSALMRMKAALDDIDQQVTDIMDGDHEEGEEEVLAAAG